MQFFDKIQILRQNAGLTQDEFASRIGVSRQAISKWESGTAYPDLNNLQSVCLFFSVSPDGLLNPNAEAVRLTEEEVRFDVSSLGENLKQIRSAKGIAQEVFADALGVSRQSVSKWENGTAIPKTELLLQMLPILGVSFSELLPQATQLPQPTEASEKALESVLSPDEEPKEINSPVPTPPPAKKRRRFLFWLIPVAAVTVCLITAAILGAILFVPFLNADRFYDTLTNLFFDPAPIQAVTDRWVKDGVEITLGTGENAPTLSLRMDDTTVAIGGFSEKVILLPRVNAREAMEASCLHPESGSPLALGQSDYTSLLSVLEALEKNDNADAEEKALRETLQAIARILEEQVESETAYGFVQGGFALDKTVTYSLDLESASVLLDRVAEVIEKNESLNNLFGLGDSLSDMHEMLQTPTLARIITDAKKDLKRNYSSWRLTVSYTLRAGELTGIRLEETCSTKEKEDYHVLCEILPVTDQKGVGADIRITSTAKSAEFTASDKSEYVYRKTITDTKTTLTLSVEERTETEDEHSGESYTYRETHSLEHDKTTHAYVYSHKIPEWESETRVCGVWNFDPVTASLQFSVASVEMDGETLFENTASALSVRALDEGAASREGVELFAMTEEETYDLYRHLPAKKWSAWFAELTGEELAVLYSEEGYLVTKKAQDSANAFADAFESYQKHNTQAQKLPSNKIYVYDSENQIYVFLTYSAANKIIRSYAYTLTDEHLKVYHEAAFSHGSMTVHHVEAVQTVAPTCTGMGRKYYECTDCGKKYSVTVASLGHAYLKKSMSVVTDDNVSRTVKYDLCSRCGASFQVEISGYAMLYLTPSPAGGHAVSDYACLGGVQFSIPDVLAELFGINQMPPEQSRYYKLIRIPNGIVRIPKKTFPLSDQLQVLILPSSLTEIADGAFGATPKLHTIFYCGTEEEWARVKLNGYQTAWENVEVIFCPDGVSPETAASSYD